MGGNDPEDVYVNIYELCSLSFFGEGENFILLGAPHLGKTSVLKRLVENNSNWKFIQDFKEIETLTKELDGVIIDDFYTFFSRLATEDAGVIKEKLGIIFELIDSKDTTICLSTTPYRWEYLSSLWEDDIENIFRKFIIKLLYCPKDKAYDIIIKENEIKKGKIEKILREIKWEYKFSKKLAGRINLKKYLTYVPTLASIDALSFYKTVKESTIISIKETISHAIYDTGKSIMETLIGTGAVTATASGYAIAGIPTLYSGIPFAFVSLLLFSILQNSMEKKVDYIKVKSFFGGIVNLRPTEMETIERKTNLPPLTLQNIRKFLTNPELIDNLNNLINSDIIDELNKLKTLDIQRTIEDIKGELKEFGDFVNYFREEYIKSLNDIDILKNIIGSDLSNQLYGRKTDLDRIVKFLDNDKHLIVIKGPCGIGKTMLAYSLGKILREDDYFIKVPDFGKDLSFIINRLKQAPHTKKIVISEYEMAYSFPLESKEFGKISVSDMELRRFISQIDRENIEVTIVLVCRSEYFEKLESNFRWMEREGSPFVGRKPEIIELTELKESDIGNIIVETEERYGKYLEETERKRIKIISEGNPLIAIEATKYALDGHYIENLTSEEILWKRISNIFENETIANVVSAIALTRGMYVDDLWAFTGVSNIIQQKKIAAVLSNYIMIGKEGEREFYRLHPDIYTNVVFDRFLMEYDYCHDYIKRCSALSFQKYLPSVALNLSMLHITHLKDKKEKRAYVVNTLIDFLKIIDDADESMYSQSIFQLAFSRAAIKADNIDWLKIIKYLNKIYSPQRVSYLKIEEADYNVISFIANIIGHLLAGWMLGYKPHEVKNELSQWFDQINYIVSSCFDDSNVYLIRELYTNIFCSWIIDLPRLSKMGAIDDEEVAIWLNEIDSMAFRESRKLKPFLAHGMTFL
ncbi:MAG: hypothetical protein ACTSU6_03955, partial [Candidatus Njordarchaeales archaeon]